MRDRLTAIPLLAQLTVLLAALLAYWPGLHGSFLFDDFANLPALGAIGPVDNWPAFWRYITSGAADPTGRPLTLLTFLIDARDWPADPYSFKRTSLILHLINGLLLALLLRNLGKTFKYADAKRVDMAAVLGAGLWLLHPLFVSTTLYIVQREAMLPATFTMLGLLLWLRGRSSMRNGKIFSGWLWILCGLGGCTLFATFSKANGILLPTLALAIEYTILRNVGDASRLSSHNDHIQKRSYGWAISVFMWVPTILLGAYLLQQGWNGFTRGISAIRPWTLYQRLLTEPRVLMSYLDLLWLPRPFTAGLFNDQIIASSSLRSPATTLPSLLAVLALIVGSWYLRKRSPATALAILFYFIGQSLESSTLPLELYFEHRNYLPAALMFWPLALWLCNVRLLPSASTLTVDNAASENRPTAWNRAKLCLSLALLLGLGLMSHAGASLWGNTHDQALLWAILNPNSARAQANAAQAEINAGHPARAVIRLKSALIKAPDQVQLALNLLGAECQLGHIDEATLIASQTALRSTRDPGALLVSWFDRVIDQAASPPCPELNLQTINDLLDAIENNAHLTSIAGRRQDLDYLRGRLVLRQGQGNAALILFDRALDQQVRATVALEQAALMGSSGFPRQGLNHLDYYLSRKAQTEAPGFGMPWIHAWILQRQQFWPSELSRLRATLLKDISH